ncbi:Proteasome subunit beta type-4 [Cichlidogyrus casuarinus]|uniref:Proteasome subunit beta type-4 n=1 Tax=Cichlidogyrus casuarinus TaxID=1844966 RepID=A0ABD2QJJ1_9PLAT
MFDRIYEVNRNCVIGASGDMADFQFLRDILKEETTQDSLLDDGFEHSARAVHSWITRVLYNRRCRFNPLWNVYLVGGLDENKIPYLGYTNLLGVSFSEDCVATGFGTHLALPHLRLVLEKCDGYSNLNESDAVTAITEAMRILYCRDCRAFNKYSIAVITEMGVTIQKQVKLEVDWNIAKYVRGYE